MSGDVLPTLWQDARGRVGRVGVGCPERLLYVGCALAAVAVAVQTSAHLANTYVFDGAHGALDADSDGNAFTWASSSATFAAAVFALLLALRDPGRSLLLGVLAATLALFSLDDAVMLHERAGLEILEALGLDSFWVRAAWPVLLLPLLAFVAAALWSVAASASSGQRRAVRAGLGLLVVAVMLEIALAAVPAGGAAWGLLEPVEVALEEAAELAGWIIIAAGLAGIFAARVDDSLVQGSRPS